MNLRNTGIMARLLFLAFLATPVGVFSAQLSLSWTFPGVNSDGTPLTDLAGARIYYGTSSGQYSEVIDVPGGEPGQEGQITLTGLEDGVTYFLTGTAYSTAGLESDFVAEVVRIAESEDQQSTPVVTAWPVAATITYGQTLAQATLSGGSASVPGVFAFVSPNTAPDAGTASHAVRFTPADTANYTTVDGTVSVTVESAIQNQAPVVNAGPGGTVIVRTAIQMQGAVSDDGLPSNGQLTTIWGVVSASGNAKIDNLNNPDTTVTFQQAGTYVLRLTASDGQLSAHDDVTFDVVIPPPRNLRVTE